MTTRSAAIFILINRTRTATVVIAPWGKIIGVTGSAKTCVLREAIHNGLTVAVAGYTRY